MQIFFSGKPTFVEHVIAGHNGYHNNTLLQCFVDVLKIILNVFILYLFNTVFLVKAVLYCNIFAFNQVFILLFKG